MTIVRNLLLESGHLNVEFKVKRMVQDWNQYSGAYVVTYESKGKDWIVVVDSEFTQIMDFSEVTTQSNPEEV